MSNKGRIGLKEEVFHAHMYAFISILIKLLAKSLARNYNLHRLEGPESMEMSESCLWVSVYLSGGKINLQNSTENPQFTDCVRCNPWTYDASYTLGQVNSGEVPEIIVLL